jgi:hypothetical protein
MHNSDVEQVEISIKEAKEAISTRDDLIKLSKNPMFDRIINVGFFEKEASRLVMLKANPGVQDADNQAGIIKTIDSIGELRQYFQKIINIGNMAENSLDSYEEDREALLQEIGGF